MLVTAARSDEGVREAHGGRGGYGLARKLEDTRERFFGTDLLVGYYFLTP